MRFAAIENLYGKYVRLLEPASGIAPLALRLFLAPVLIQAGWTKYAGFSGTVRFFDHLGIPFPELMVALTIAAELVGGIFILVGLMTRLAAVPLMVTMLVAAFTVHWDNGWLTLSDGSSWLANDRVIAAQEYKSAVRELAREHKVYRGQHGSITILNNGIQFAITYFVMLLSLFFTGGGRYTSIDYWFGEIFRKSNRE